MVAALATGNVRAEITVGVVLGASGPTASISIPYRNTYQIVPRTLGGEKARFIILDDTGNPGEA